MTLHEAIVLVLTAMNGLTTTAIANEMNSQNLYQREDGNDIQASQISARINQYSKLFTISDNKIFLTEKNLFNLNNKVFKVLSNSENGEVDESTLFYYHQEDNLIWADYHGKDILKGNLIGKQLKNGKFDFVYHHVNQQDELKIGKCLSQAKILENGKIKLFEKWQWLCDDMSSGESELIEVDN